MGATGLNSPPGEDDRSDGLVHLENEVDGEELLPVLWASWESIHRCRRAEGEHADSDEDGRFLSRDSDDPGGEDVGDDSNRAGDHVVQDGLEWGEAETAKNESWD